MEISDIRKADAAKKAALKAKADQYMAEATKPRPAVPVVSVSADAPAPLVLCGSCRHWEAPDAKAVFAACGLSRHSGLPTAMATTDKMTCSRAEKR
jgi:hypothetical protein